MDFSGWEKLSLVDFDDNLTTTLFMAGCPFRCPYCHNSDLVLRPNEAPKIPWEEILEYLKKRRGVLDAVCVSGGEPTLMNDLKEKLSDIKSLGYKVKLDTNGVHPNILRELADAKLVDYFAMDIKNSPKKYGMTIGLPNFDITPILSSIDFLLHSGVDYEFRTTLVEEFHDEEDIREIKELIAGAKRYYLQRYIDNENCIVHGLHEVSVGKALGFLDILKPSIGAVALRGYDTDRE